ncbi:MazG-like family protein [Micromonospora sp. WMMD1082]|uniref:MazG-like family protein n=1 Tax=Micromonospora sp. WMMD1082 TaxID=3016104 RepID=UPI0024162988|nr:MazG-like family protein [Micromonospora sp. WMMD1082]MDG4797304.1 MazG-like family protein [Micromonospora sp. WMMD1082]
MDETIWQAVRTARGWLDEANGTGQAELTCRMLKLTEEAGEVAGAWIGLLGQNPRKGVTHTREDVAAELADAAFTALVAIESLGLDARAVLGRCAGKVAERVGERPGASGANPGPRESGPAGRGGAERA